MVVGGVKMAPVWLESASGGGGTLEKSENCLNYEGTKVGADPGIPSV